MAENFGFDINVGGQVNGLQSVLDMLTKIQQAADGANAALSQSNASPATKTNINAQAKAQQEYKQMVESFTQSHNTSTQAIINNSARQRKATEDATASQRTGAQEAQRSARILQEAYRQQAAAALSYYADVEASQSKVIGSMLKGQALQQFSQYAKDAADSIINAAADAQQGFARLAVTQDNSTPAQIEKLNGDIASVANNMTSVYGKTQAIATDLGQAGVAADKLSDATEAVSKFTNATDVNAGNAANSLARVYQQIGNGKFSFQELTNAQFVVSNMATATADDVLKMTTTLAPVAKNFNIATNDIIGFGGAMSSAGISAQALNTSMTRTLGQMASGINKGGAEAQVWATQMGTTVDDLKAKLNENPFETYLQFTKSLINNKEGVTGFYQSLKTLGVNARFDQKILSSVGQNFDEIKKESAAAGQALGTTSDLTKAYGKTSETFNGSLTRLKNTLTSLSMNSAGLDTLVVPINALQAGLDQLFSATKDGNPFAVFVSSMASFITPAAALGGRIGNVAGKMVQLSSVSESVRLQYAQMAAATGQYTNQISGMNDQLQISALRFRAQKAAAQANEVALSSEKNFGISGASIIDTRSSIQAQTAGATRYEIINRLQKEGTEALRRNVSVAQENLRAVVASTGAEDSLLSSEERSVVVNKARNELLIQQQQLRIANAEYEAQAAAAEANSTRKGVGVAGGGVVARTVENTGEAAGKAAGGFAQFAGQIGNLLSKTMMYVGAAYGLFAVVTSVIGAVNEASKAHEKLAQEIDNPRKAWDETKVAAEDYTQTVAQGQTAYQQTGDALEVLKENIVSVAQSYDDAADSAQGFAAVAYTKDMNNRLASDIFNTKGSQDFGATKKDDSLLSIITNAGKAQDGVKGINRSFDDLVKSIQSNAIDDSVMKEIDTFQNLGAQIKAVKDASNGGFASKVGDFDNKTLGDLTGMIKTLQTERQMNEQLSMTQGAAGVAGQRIEAIDMQIKSLRGLQSAMTAAGASASDNVGAWESFADRMKGSAASINSMNDAMKNTQYLSSLSSQTPVSMESLANTAEAMKKNVDDVNKMREGLNDVADAGYKAAHGLAQYSDMGKLSGSVTSQVADIMDKFSSSPDAAALALVNLGDTMNAVGVSSGKDMDYVSSMLRQVTMQLNSTYGFNIDTSNANASVNELKANIISTIAAMSSTQAFKNAVNSNADSTPFFRGVIRMHALSNQMQLSETQARQAATQATENNTKANKSNSDSNKDNARTVDELASDLQRLVNWYNQFAFGVGDAQNGIADALRDIDEQLKKTDELADKVSDTLDKIFGRQNAKDELLSQIDSMRNGIEDAREKWNELNATLSEQQAQESQLQYWLKQAQAVGDVARQQQILAQIEKNRSEQNSTRKQMSDAEKTMSPTAVGDSMGAISGRKGLQDLTKAYMEYGVALKKSGMSDDDVQKNMSGMQEEFSKFALSLGFTTDEIKPYVDALKSTLYTMDESSKSSKTADETMRDLVSKYQTLAQSMVSAGMSQSDINNAMNSGAATLKTYGQRLGLSSSAVDKYVNSLVDLQTLVENIPPVTLSTNLSPVQNALTLFFNKMQEDAAKTGKSAGDGLSGGGSAGGGLKQSLSEILDAQMKMEKESLSSFNSWIAGVQSISDSSSDDIKTKTIDMLLNLSSATTLSVEEQRNAWTDAYDKIGDNSDLFRSKMIQSFQAVATETGVTSNATQGAWEAAISFMSNKLNGENQDSFKQQFKAGMISVYKQSNMSSEDIKNDWKAKVDQYKSYMPESMYNELLGWSGDMQKAGNSTADSVKNGIVQAFSSKDVQDAISTAIYNAINPNSGWSVGQSYSASFLTGFRSWLNGNKLDLSLMFNNPQQPNMINSGWWKNAGGPIKHGFAEGGSYGLLRGIGGTTGDRNITALSDWEFVVRASSVRHGNNLAYLQYLNKTGELPVQAYVGSGSSITPQMFMVGIAMAVSAIESNNRVAIPVSDISYSQRRVALSNGSGYFG